MKAFLIVALAVFLFGCVASESSYVPFPLENTSPTATPWVVPMISPPHFEPAITPVAMPVFVDEATPVPVVSPVARVSPTPFIAITPEPTPVNPLGSPTLFRRNCAQAIREKYGLGPYFNAAEGCVNGGTWRLESCKCAEAGG